MKQKGKLFPVILFLAFSFRLVAICCFPGSTNTVYSGSSSFRYKNFYSDTKRRRNIEDCFYNSEKNATAETHSVQEIFFLEESNIILKRSIFQVVKTFLLKIFDTTADLAAVVKEQTRNFLNTISYFLAQKSTLSVSILRV